MIEMPPTQTPEEQELAAKNVHLGTLTTRLTQRELDLATLQAELRAFEQQYLRVVGVAFAEIDDLEAQIAEELKRRTPTDEPTRQRAVNARTKATESAGAAADAIEQRTRVDVTRSDELRSHYREATKRVHPDLATTDAERAKRNQVMVDVNRAYTEGDEARLRAILNEWDTSPDAVTGDGIGSELVRTLRKIHQVEVRLAAIESAFATLKDSDLFRLKVRVDAGRINGQDVLAEMVEQLAAQIVRLRRRRDDLRMTGERS
jgi:hypothetical protein